VLLQDCWLDCFASEHDGSSDIRNRKSRFRDGRHCLKLLAALLFCFDSPALLEQVFLGIG
jgi:hypothetical protein